MEQGYQTKVIKIGGFSHVRAVLIGGHNPIAIQTMWKDRLKHNSLNEAVKKIEELQAIGCDLLRFAVPDMAGAELLGQLAGMVSMPLVADIHFDYKIALRCMDFPIAKIRINPGNIGSAEKTKIVLEKADKKNIPIRIGVNAGSLPKDAAAETAATLSAETAAASAADLADALVQTAMREISIFEEFGFKNYLVSMKASTIADTISANKKLSGLTDAPLHVGVTEAGPLIAGVTRNAAALLALLSEGIGDTVRVSLSDSMENEVITAREIIAAAAQLAPGNQRLKCFCSAASSRGVNIISCPRCGRAGFDTHGFTSRWMQKLYALDRDISIAIMGCEVNGPVEAKHADLGITGAGNKVLIFKHGEIIRTITADMADTAFEEELKKL